MPVPVNAAALRFVHPEAFLLLWLLLPLLAVWLLAGRARRHAARRFRGAVTDLGRNLRPLLACLTLLGYAALVVAVARPGWESQATTLERRGRDVVFVVDVSRSMLAEDLAPNRLERAKLAILDTLEQLSGDRVALVAFAGSAVVKSPLTFDYGFFRLAVQQLSVTSVARGGSLVGDALRTVRDQVFDDRTVEYRDVLLITDGGDHDSFPAAAAEELGQRGVRLLAVGLGDDSAGQPIPLAGGSTDGQPAYVEHEGQMVLSQLDADLLRAIAGATPGGRYIHVATGNVDLGRLYQELIASASGRLLETESVELVRERFQTFIAISLLLLALALVMPERMALPRVRLPRLLHPASRSGASARIVFLLGVLCWLGAGATVVSAAGRPERAARDGLAAYRAGDYATAVDAFGTATRLRPGVPELLYDAGVSAYQLGDYATARARLHPAISGATRPELAAAGHLALGNIGMREAQQLLQQDPTAAIPALEEGIASFERALRVDPDYAAAAHNLELARVLLDELRQQQRQQQQQQQQSPQQDSGEQDQQQHEQQEGRQPESAPRDDGGPTPPASGSQEESREEQPAPAPPGGEDERMDDLLARQIIAAEEANAELRRRRQLQLLPVQRDW